MGEGLTLAEIRAKYCEDWMQPYPNLKFVSINQFNCKSV